MREAAKRGYVSQLEEYIKSNPEMINKKDTLGNTPLNWAANGGHPDSVLVLLKAGANPMNQNLNGDTPLHQAAAKNSAQSCLHLIQNGGGEARNVKNQNGSIPVQLAKSLDTQAACQPLIEDDDEDFDQEEG